MKVLIFGGTTEGRQLFERFCQAEIPATLSVATEYGRQVAETKLGAASAPVAFAPSDQQIRCGRLSEAEMVALLEEGGYDYVVDATHPYAAIVSECIRAAVAQVAGVKYLRLLRPEGSFGNFADDSEVAGEEGDQAAATKSHIHVVPNVTAAAQLLNQLSGKALLTTGSKELQPFTAVDNFAERLYPRVLPMLDSLEKALSLGFLPANIICMQGPFDFDLNCAMLKMSRAKILVTKDSGDLGGFEEKLRAAETQGCDVIVISRPLDEEGLSFDQTLEFFGLEKLKPQGQKTQGLFGLEKPELVASKESSPSPFFPIYIDLGRSKILVVGGGSIAERRIKALVGRGAKITVVSSSVSESVAKLVESGELELIQRKYQSEDACNLKPDLVIAATNDRETNHQVMLDATGLKAQVSVADRRQECSFYFPATMEDDRYLAALVSKTADHSAVRKTAAKIRELLAQEGQTDDKSSQP